MVGNRTSETNGCCKVGNPLFKYVVENVIHVT